MKKKAKKKRRNRGHDERRVLGVPPALEDPPVTPAHVDEFVRRIAHIPREKWSRLVYRFMEEQNRKQGDAFWKRVASGTTDLVGRRLKPMPDDRYKSFLTENWDTLREWHPEAVLKLLRGKGLWCGGIKWYEKERKKLGLLPCTCERPRRSYSVPKPS